MGAINPGCSYGRARRIRARELSISFGGGDPPISYAVDYQGGGLDLQYRRYFGPWAGARGLFIAPGIAAAAFSAQGTDCWAPTIANGSSPIHRACEPNTQQSWTNITGSFDVGGQGIVGPGPTLGASVGARATAALGNYHGSLLPFDFKLANGAGPGIRARLWAGWAF